MPPYQERWPVGSRVRVVSRELLDGFSRTWHYHHALRPEQLPFAGRDTTVRGVGYYHGGDVLYELDAVPGLWLEQCVEDPATAIDWANLTDAYGAASDIPKLLIGLRTAPPPNDYRDEPWFSLWSALCHQGDVYSASLAAVPELIWVAADREVAAQAECLYLAALIELERHTDTAPGIPEDLLPAYEKAITDGARLATSALGHAPTEHVREILDISRAVLSGEFTLARRLLAEE